MKLPRVRISGDGYCLPAQQLEDGSFRWIVGPSFDEGKDDLSPRQASDDFNREQAKGLVNYSEGNTASLIIGGKFVGVRCCVAGDRWYFETMARHFHCHGLGIQGRVVVWP